MMDGWPASDYACHCLQSFVRGLEHGRRRAWRLFFSYLSCLVLGKRFAFEAEFSRAKTQRKYAIKHHDHANAKHDHVLESH